MNKEMLTHTVKCLLDVVGGEGLRYHVMAAHLITHCHDPVKVTFYEEYTGGATLENLYKQYLPYDDETGAFASVDPLALLYELGRKDFARRGIDPADIARMIPLNQQERDCLETLLSDQRIPYSRHESYHHLIESDSLSEASEDDFLD